MIQGFLRISRNIVDWDWYTDANTFRVFMHLLLTANYKDCVYKGVEVKRGQVATSRMEIAKALRMSEQNVRTSLSHLKSTSEITSKSTNKLTIITLCKYDSWQDLASETNQQTNREVTDKLTINQPTIEEESNKNNNKEKEDTNVSPKKKDEWRDNYDVYVSLVDDALGKLFVDENYKNQMEQLYTNIDYKRTLIACSLYWKQEEQWKKYKRKKTKKPNFVSAIKNGFHISKVYKSKYASEIKEYGYPKSVEDVTIDDTQSTLIQFQYWMEGKMIKVWDGFDKGFPTTDAQYKMLLDHTIGGAKGLSYVVLVFNRDGWDKYKDERGFMFTYSNYIKANGLYKE